MDNIDDRLRLLMMPLLMRAMPYAVDDGHAAAFTHMLPILLR